MGISLHENRHDWRSLTALLLYQISTRYLKPFMNYSGLKIRKSSTYTHIHTSGRQLKIIFLGVLDHSEYFDTNISIFFSGLRGSGGRIILSPPKARNFWVCSNFGFFRSLGSKFRFVRTLSFSEVWVCSTLTILPIRVWIRSKLRFFRSLSLFDSNDSGF